MLFHIESCLQESPYTCFEGDFSENNFCKVRNQNNSKENKIYVKGAAANWDKIKLYRESCLFKKQKSVLYFY